MDGGDKQSSVEDEDGPKKKGKKIQRNIKTHSCLMSNYTCNYKVCFINLPGSSAEVIAGAGAKGAGDGGERQCSLEDARQQQQMLAMLDII